MKLVEFLGAHWVAVAAVVAAALFFALFAWKKTGLVAGVLAAAFGLGALTLGDAKQDWLGPPAPVAQPLLALAGLAFLFAGVTLAFARRWHFAVGVALFAFLNFALGAAVEGDLTYALTEVGRSARALEFVRPLWLLLLLLVPVVVLLARKSLGGLGPVRKWVAIGCRCVVVALLAMALAEPRVKRPSEHVTVLFVVDRSLSVPQDVDLGVAAADQVDRRWERIRTLIDSSVRQRGPDRRDDRAGVILFGKRPKLALPPAATDRMPVDERMAGPIDGNYTDIAAALKLALASFPEGTGKRVVVVSDGNENIGNAEEQAALARQNGVPIDVVALAPGFRNESEVLVQAVEAPRTTASGQRLPVRVLVRNASPNRVVEGVLELVRVGLAADGSELIELVGIDADNPLVDSAEPNRPSRVRLLPGLNSFRFRDKPAAAGESSFSYRSTFTPVRTADDAGRVIAQGLPGDRVANNRAGTAVVSRGQQRVLFVDAATGNTSPHQHLMDTLARRKIRVDYVRAGRLPTAKADFGLFLTNFDLIVLANVPAESFTGDQMEAMRASVHDQGCGLIMVGGPEAYGPGGYQGTPVEAALPVDCEIKALKAAGKGGLILIMHASEMAQGNKWQIEMAKLAINRLTPNDMVGVMQYGFGASGVAWVVPFQSVGDNKNGLKAKVDGMSPGDMPDFDPFLSTAVDELIKEEHGLAVRHTIVISDGDPQYGAIGRAAVAKMKANKVSCTTVGVATHSGAESGKLKSISAGTEDAKGNPGGYYEPKSAEELPQIYIKESRRVSQSFIFDKPFQPMLRLRGGPTDGLPGNLPQLRGFVRTTMKDNPLAEMQIEGPTVFDQRFPVLATWQYGLGKAAAFTSDARSQPGGVSGWDADWVGSDIYQKHWEQVVSWAMRAAEKGKLTLQTDYRDGRVRVTVDARDDKDKPMSGLDLKAGISLPRPVGAGERTPSLQFKRKGPGLYEAEFPAEEAGSYFVYVQGAQGGKLFDASRSGVTVPYSPEFSDLESNTPLLKRLADATGGNFYTDEDDALKALAKSGNLFRDAPKSIRALLPFWFWLVFGAGLVLLADVAVRRVAVEPAEVRLAAQKLWSAVRHTAEAEAPSAGMDRLLKRKQAAEETLNRERSARRFDAGSGPRAEPAPAGADEVVGSAPKPAPAAKPAPKPAEEPGESAMDRLKKARDRARKKTERPDDNA